MSDFARQAALIFIVHTFKLPEGHLVDVVRLRHLQSRDDACTADIDGSSIRTREAPRRTPLLSTSSQRLFGAWKYYTIIYLLLLFQLSDAEDIGYIRIFHFVDLVRDGRMRARTASDLDIGAHLKRVPDLSLSEFIEKKAFFPGSFLPPLSERICNPLQNNFVG